MATSTPRTHTERCVCLDCEIERTKRADEERRAVEAPAKEAAREAYMAGQPERLAALDALLAPIEATAKAIDDGLEAEAKRRDEEAKAAARLIERKSIPLASEQRQAWGEIRALPDVAPLIADGWQLVGVERDFAGRRVAELARKRREA